VQVGIERVRDAQKRVDSGRSPSALEPRDGGLRRSDELGEVGLGEASLLAPVGHLAGDLREEPALLGAGEPGTDALHGLTHISIMLYIAIMRYVRKIAVIAYFVLQIVWVVGVDHSLFYGSDGATVSVLSVVALANLGLGLTTAWWLAPALPLLTVAMAAPLGIPNGNYHEPLPIWFGVLLVAPVESALVAVGVAARNVWDWSRPSEAA
jgi:hypothetical protein